MSTKNQHGFNVLPTIRTSQETFFFFFFLLNAKVSSAYKTVSHGTNRTIRFVSNLPLMVIYQKLQLQEFDTHTPFIRGNSCVLKFTKSLFFSGPIFRPEGEEKTQLQKFIQAKKQSKENFIIFFYFLNKHSNLQ